MPILPDTKDWTWVLERPCPECGYDAATVEAGEVARLIRENASRWPAVLTRSDVRERPDENTWSALEYGAHVRDVFRISRTRLAQMRAEHDPVFANWDQDATAIEDRYSEQDPSVVSRELVDVADALAADFESITQEEWDRPGRRSDGAIFTVASFARYITHDWEHHIVDVRG
jgi:hypothetical protein